MTRSGSSVFIKDTKEQSSKTSFCSSCEEKFGRIIALIPRLIDGIPDDHFKLCPNCTELIPIHEAMLETEYEPKGYLNPNNNPFDSGLKVKAVSEKRKIRTIHTEGIEPIEIPNFGNKPDKDLERLVAERPAVINYIHDVVVEEG